MLRGWQTFALSTNSAWQHCTTQVLRIKRKRWQIFIFPSSIIACFQEAFRTRTVNVIQRTFQEKRTQLRQLEDAVVTAVCVQECEHGDCSRETENGRTRILYRQRYVVGGLGAVAPKAHWGLAYRAQGQNLQESIPSKVRACRPGDNAVKDPNPNSAVCPKLVRTDVFLMYRMSCGNYLILGRRN